MTKLGRLAIDGRLICSVDHVPIEIEAKSGVVRVEVAEAIRRRGELNRRVKYPSRSQLVSLHDFLDKLHLRLEVTLRGVPVLCLGAETGSSCWKLLGLPPLEFRARQLFGLWLRDVCRLRRTAEW